MEDALNRIKLVQAWTGSNLISGHMVNAHGGCPEQDQTWSGGTWWMQRVDTQRVDAQMGRMHKWGGLSTMWVHRVPPDQVWSCSGHPPCAFTTCPLIKLDPVQAWSRSILFIAYHVWSWSVPPNDPIDTLEPPRHKVGRRPKADPCGAARILRERSDLKF